ncbi:protein Shroom4 isoform X3 [Hemibagrus wyckioides]|uniref:protein Shroom4 isoform X3 n=1 Tax=Hemibagrus wyckioides TaxID=337641 RepID=UPI00266C44B3|nr:protein Shroom4 isoform X3 [Hemibagrus wyckioides]
MEKIEEGGKAAECKKLRVGDELVNINGSALYGSRQEALILIKGSYRVLKIVVRRRTVPLIHPHTWHLVKLAEEPSVPGSAGSSDGPLAMQLHPTPFSVPWHSGGDSELSMPLGHLSRHYSTDRSSSVGSMESLENPPSQGYYESQLSPIDPAIFNNKRDSAYSSFSASSNTSDYTVSLRPEENSSMDSLLQGFGPSCRFTEGHPHSTSSGQGEVNCEDGILKSRSLPHRPEAKVRPSSYSYEENKCGPPVPPMRKDSFRATKGLPEVMDKRCVSAPVGVSALTIEDPPEIHKALNGNRCLNGQENEQNLKGNKAETYYTIDPQKDIDNQVRSTEECQKSSHFQALERHSTRPSPPAAESLDSQLNHLDNTLQPRMHRHSVPEKLLVSQLHMMELSSNNSAHSMPPSSLWSNTLHPREELIEDNPDVAQGKWGGSRCSTPGSLTTSELEEHGVEGESFDSGQRLTPVQHTWGRSVSVPGETIGNGFDGSGPCIDSQFQERGFETISAATSMDTLLENQEEGECKGDGDISKPPQKRQFRSSKSRRRSERFATNLRNEIQRKKAQLQKGKGPGGLLCDGETVEEEDIEEKSPSEVPAIHQHRPQTQTSQYNSFQNFAPSQVRPIASNSTFPGRCCGTNPAEHSRRMTEDIHHSQDESHGIQSAEINRPVCVRVVEELAPPGKARRWRWTPEHKLQPEIESTETKKNSEGTAPSSRNLATTRGRVGSSGGRSTRADDCDIPPFADRRKFFEETSRNLSQSVTNLAGLTSHRQRPEKHGRNKELTSPEPLESVPDLGRRRFSYQGGLNDGTLVNSFDSRRKNVQQERDRERENTLEREWKKQRENEKQREKEREQEMQNEQERLQAWEMEQERERERARKETEREQQRVQQMERDWETSRDRFYAGHNINNITVLPPLPQDSLKQPLMTQNLTMCNSHSDSFHNKPNPDIQKPCSAFRPVTSQQYQSDHYRLHPGYKARSCTPTEAFPVHELEQTKLRRKFSLTERDYTQCRRDSRSGEVTVGRGFQCQWNNRLCGFNNEDQPIMSSNLTNRTMSENDIRMETKCLRSHGAAATNNSRMSSSIVRELDENVVSVVETKKKKGPPPPRPPPPKWEQFHKRRASHHSLFSSQTSSSSQLQTYTPCPSTAQEMTRQRSYSLPPRDDTISHQAPLNPTLNNRAFKPVALPPKERDTTRIQHYDTNSSGDTPTSLNESNQRLSEQSFAQPSDQYRPAVVKPVIYKHRAEWDLTSPHNYTVSSNVNISSVPGPTLENGSCSGPVNPESYFTVNYNHQQHLQNQLQQICMPVTTVKTLEPSTQSAPPSEDQGLPFETDIDEFRENEGTSVEQQRRTEDRIEMQCFAQPVTVLETDIDTVTDEEAPSSGMRRGQRASIVDSLMEEDCGRAGKELMGELFPHYAGNGAEGWRGGNIVSGDMVERSSRQSPSLPQGSSSTSHRGSTNKTQLLNKMPNFMETKEEDEELNYKRQLMESLRKKLGVLREAQRGLQEDIRANAQLGEEVESLVLAVCKPNEVDKFRMFIGDLDKVTSLLLSLSGRLLRVESALDCLDPESGHRERLPLLDKKKQLLAQLAEAQELKEHVDRREEAVGRVLSRCLTPEQLRDYSHFVKMKAALLVEQRQLDDKIRLGEEQLRGLKESLGLGYGPY